MPPNRTDKKSGDNSPNSAGSANQPRDMRRKLSPHGWSRASSQLNEAGPLSQGRFGIVGSTCSSQRQGPWVLHTAQEDLAPFAFALSSFVFARDVVSKSHSNQDSPKGYNVDYHIDTRYGAQHFAIRATRKSRVKPITPPQPAR
ncbi:hypothetical protein FOXYSP1_05511 [Fusarium oxysporum f. sp. phaseoli]